MNILLLDDEILQIESLTRGLRSKGHHVQNASTCQEAIDLLQNRDQRINVIITDYAMSISESRDLVRCIKENYDYLPVIVMTSGGDVNHFINPLCSMCSRFIEKPFSLGELVRLIERTN